MGDTTSSLKRRPPCGSGLLILGQKLVFIRISQIAGPLDCSSIEGYSALDHNPFTPLGRKYRTAFRRALCAPLHGRRRNESECLDSPLTDVIDSPVSLSDRITEQFIRYLYCLPHETLLFNRVLAWKLYSRPSTRRGLPTSRQRFT